MKNSLAILLLVLWTACSTSPDQQQAAAPTSATPAAATAEVAPTAEMAQQPAQPVQEKSETPATKAPKKPGAAPAAQSAAAAGTGLVWATDLDLICQMRVERTTPDTAHYKGKIYGFCCTGCKVSFQEDPAYWLAKMVED